MSTRLAYVCADPGVPVFGSKGASVHVREMLRAFRRAGVTPDVYATSLGGHPPADLAGLAVELVPIGSAGDAPRRERAAAEASARLAQRLTCRQYDLVYERYSLWSHAPMEWARRAGATAILEVNAPLIEEQARHRTLVDRAGAERVAARAFVAADAVLAVSEGVAAWVRVVAPAVGAKLRVVPNGVDPARFTTRYGNGLDGSPSAPFVIGFVGTLKPWHGLETLIDAFVRVRDRVPARLLIVGDGPERHAVEARLRASGLYEHASFTGAVDPDEVPTWLARMHVAVAPYPDLPGFYFSPLKLFEYMAAGLPVVASAVGQVPEIIADGVTGLLCPAGDPEALAAALLGIAYSPPLAADLGNAARREVELRHSWDHIAARVLSLAPAMKLEEAG